MAFAQRRRHWRPWARPPRLDRRPRWYQVDLIGGEGKTYWVELNGQGVAGYTLQPWVPAIFTSDGTVSYPGAGADSVAGGFELEPTTYYVVVRGKPDLSSGTDGAGTYGTRQRHDAARRE